MNELAKQSYSQFAEDLIAESILLRVGVKLSSESLYIDVGACWPKKYSNTFRFYRNGWSGLCIDPRPGFQVEFARDRPRDTCVNVGVSDVPGSLDYYMFDNPVFNTFEQDRAERLASSGLKGRTLLEVQQIPVEPLHSIVARTIGFERKVQFVSIDVEGQEEKVLISADLSTFRPTLFVLEFKSKGVAHFLKSPLCHLMTQNGYICITVTNQNVFFLDGAK